MRLHHLTMEGVGPFKDRVSLDLAALGASGIFLLEGPTGSGKSTVLDAISFALYGGVAGRGSDAQRIRSHFAPDAKPSVVDLIFETGQGIYRVRRQPEYQRPKLRGTGTTRENARAVLWRLGSPELIPAVIADITGQGGTAELVSGMEPIASRLDDVGREITRAVGLTREQFTQTVLLPQNEFARFLRADTTERQAVLQRVFGTEIYEQVEQQLAAMKQRAEKEVTAVSGELAQVVARLAQAAGLDAADEADAAALDALRADSEKLALDALTQQAAALVDRTEAAAQEAQAGHEAAKAREQQARGSAEQAQTALQHRQRRQELDALAERLRAEQAEIETLRVRFARDAAARPAIEALRRRDQAASAEEAARADVGTAADEAQEAGQQPLVDLLPGTDEDRPAAIAALAQAQQSATAEAGSLRALLEVEQALPVRRKKLTERRAVLEDSAATLVTLQNSAADLPKVRAVHLEERAAALAAAEGLPDARLATKAAQDALAAAQAAERFEQARDAAERELATAIEAAREAATAEHDLRTRRYAGIAAELAGALEPDDACPVCGSTEHPHLAQPSEDHVTPEQVEAAEEHRRTADAAVSDAEHRRNQAAARRDEQRELAGGLDADAARAAVERAQAEEAQLLAQQQKVAALDAKLAENERLTAGTAKSIQDLEMRRAREATAIAEQDEQLTREQQQVDAARGAHDSIAQRHAALRREAETAGSLAGALRALTEASAQLAARRDEATAARGDAQSELTEALAALPALALAEEPQGPAQITSSDASLPVADEDLRNLALSAADRRALQGRIEADRDARRRWRDGMAEPGIAEAALGPDPDTRADALEAASAAHSAALEALREASDALEQAGGIAATTARTAQATAAAERALTEAASRTRHVQDHAGAVVRVAKLATGTSADGEKIRLSTYVLMRRFEDVITAANTRLGQFARSEFELVRATSAKGNARTGLDLRVIDRRTDTERVPATLSGGETFFVSLALALGLADIVTAEAGGVQMDTLFIDEGFGSLDPESLENVVAEIGRLAENGRTIGVVSHVGEMKSQIAEQIHVRRTPAGPSTLTVTA